MGANSGEPWSELDVADLTHSLAYGNTIADAAIRAVLSDRHAIWQAPIVEGERPCISIGRSHPCAIR
jgi:hypothetical protein